MVNGTAHLMTLEGLLKKKRGNTQYVCFIHCNDKLLVMILID